MPIFDGVLLMTDLDGTLLCRDKSVSEQNRRAAERFMRGGGLFTFATGRSLPATAHLLEHISVNAPAVMSNGCHGYDFLRSSTVYEWNIGQSALRLALAIIERFPDCGVEVHTLRGAFVARQNEYTRRHFERTKMPNIELAPCEIAPPWLKLCLETHADKMPEVIDFIGLHFADEFFLQLAAPHFLEVQGKNTDKGAGALEICHRLGVLPENFYAVGDGTNDVEFLRATKNAFAPQNACDDILYLRPRMLPTNEQHCVAALIDIIEKERMG